MEDSHGSVLHATPRSKDRLMQVDLKTGDWWSRVKKYTGHPLLAELIVAELEDGTEITFPVANLNYIED